MSNILKVEGHEGLVRDTSTLAIININESEYAAYMSRKKSFEAKKIEAKKMQDELAIVKNELFELKTMVAELLSKGK